MTKNFQVCSLISSLFWVKFTTVGGAGGQKNATYYLNDL